MKETGIWSRRISEDLISIGAQYENADARDALPYIHCRGNSPRFQVGNRPIEAAMRESRCVLSTNVYGLTTLKRVVYTTNERKQ